MSSTIRFGGDATIPVGTYVRVSDGTAQPPARFNRKLKEWQAKNFDAVVTAYRPNRPGWVTVQKLSTVGHWAIRIFYTVEVAMITPVPGKPRFVVNVDAFNPEVVGIDDGAVPMVAGEDIVEIIDEAVDEHAEVA